MPVITKLEETLATLTAQPPALGALIAHGPITSDMQFAADPSPPMTHWHPPFGEPGAVNCISDVIVIAPCSAPPPPREAAGPPSASASNETTTSSERYIETPFSRSRAHMASRATSIPLAR